MLRAFRAAAPEREARAGQRVDPAGRGGEGSAGSQLRRRSVETKRFLFRSSCNFSEAGSIQGFSSHVKLKSSG